VLAVVADMAVFAFFEDHGFRPAFNMSCFVLASG
jgi:hypothetical protein